jgi:hypothetical protein
MKPDDEAKIRVLREQTTKQQALRDQVNKAIFERNIRDLLNILARQGLFEDEELGRLYLDQVIESGAINYLPC